MSNWIKPDINNLPKQDSVCLIAINGKTQVNTFRFVTRISIKGFKPPFERISYIFERDLNDFNVQQIDFFTISHWSYLPEDPEI